MDDASRSSVAARASGRVDTLAVIVGEGRLGMAVAIRLVNAAASLAGKGSDVLDERVRALGAEGHHALSSE